jgi:hypothetical protein
VEPLLMWVVLGGALGARSRETSGLENAISAFGVVMLVCCCLRYFYLKRRQRKDSEMTDKEQSH